MVQNKHKKNHCASTEETTHGPVRTEGGSVIEHCTHAFPLCLFSAVQSTGPTIHKFEGAMYVPSYSPHLHAPPCTGASSRAACTCARSRVACSARAKETTSIIRLLRAQVSPRVAAGPAAAYIDTSASTVLIAIHGGSARPPAGGNRAMLWGREGPPIGRAFFWTRLFPTGDRWRSPSIPQHTHVYSHNA